MPGVAEQEQVAGYGVAQQLGAQAGGVYEPGSVAAGLLGDGLTHLIEGVFGVGVADELGGGGEVGIDHGMGTLLMQFRQRVV